MALVALGKKSSQVLQLESLLCLQKRMQTRKVHSVSTQVGLRVLYLCAWILRCFYSGLVQPHQQVPDIELSLSALNQQNLSHGV